ncbi:MAG: indolepyruvate ferredoxin oxidoreductase [Verrucomicrobia bacterium]|nr:indolepyruvate ferredoxin oxidoreductase [Verrucomicrobiota bacterium]
MSNLLLLGNEAVAQGALDAGISGAYAYPGTPSTEIMEHVQRSPESVPRSIHSRWSANEKTALEAALGMSYAGKRALACMKHVGLNVAADIFMNAAVTGTNGGLVVAVADDPSMHSSQNEQDSRIFSAFAQTLTLEPCDVQEAYDMTIAAFALSEALEIPVVLRLTTLLSHSRSVIVRQPEREANQASLPEDATHFMLIPLYARKNWKRLIEKQETFREQSEMSAFNTLLDGPDHSVGIIATGVAYSYARDCLPGTPPAHPILKIGQYPIPEKAIRELAASCETLLVLEDGAPMVEERVKGVLPADRPVVKGRLDGTLPRCGELTPDAIACALGQPTEPMIRPQTLPVRMPRLCKGCPHVESLGFVQEAMATFPDGRVFSDIGCYALGLLPPIELEGTCVNMGSSITMAKGFRDAGLGPSVAVIGDSTFAHSGMTALLDAVFEQTSITVVILDNGTVAMTGWQSSPVAGKIDRICEGLGVDRGQIRTLVPLACNHDSNVVQLREALAYEGVSVIIAQRECVHGEGAKR